MITAIGILIITQLICMIILVASFFIKSITEKILEMFGTIFFISSFVSTILITIFTITYLI